MIDQNNTYFWQVVVQFNNFMKSAIEGPNCIDPQVCKGDCCSIKIDVPKVLAKEYIKRGYANENDFIRSNVFSFQLRFNEKTGKCFLFDKEINGCSIHNSGIKPPQCWIYPTGFSNPENKNISCKKVSGWDIKYPKKARKAKELLQNYIFLCQIEAKKESILIKKRLGALDNKRAQNNLRALKKALINIAPHSLGGFKDMWNHIGVLSAEGISLQMKKFCLFHNQTCLYCLEDNFLGCNNICEVVAGKVIEYLVENLYPYVKEKGQDVYGDYPLFKLFKHKNISSD
ncbi:MAG: YkgJ family cysteine cluster protein [Promethearchaeota archaeon]